MASVSDRAIRPLGDPLHAAVHLVVDADGRPRGSIMRSVPSFLMTRAPDTRVAQRKLRNRAKPRSALYHAAPLSTAIAA